MLFTLSYLWSRIRLVTLLAFCFLRPVPFPAISLVSWWHTTSGSTATKDQTHLTTQRVADPSRHMTKKAPCDLHRLFTFASCPWPTVQPGRRLTTSIPCHIGNKHTGTPHVLQHKFLVIQAFIFLTICPFLSIHSTLYTSNVCKTCLCIPLRKM